MVRFCSCSLLLILLLIPLGCGPFTLIYNPRAPGGSDLREPVKIDLDFTELGPHTIIAGFVFDLHTLQPVELAYVYLNTNQVEFSMTDEEGRFTFAVPGDASTLDPFQITVSKSGYESSINTYSKIRIGSIYLKRKSDGKRMGPAFN